MEPHPAPARPSDRRRRRAGALAATVAAVLVAGLTAACGVRLETPPPSEPVPDALEVVRRTAVADALVIAQQAETVVAMARNPQVRTELERVAAASREQVTELGGPYDSGLEGRAPTASPEVSGSADPVTAADVAHTLADAAARSRSAASTTTDGPLARLLASVGASQTVSATRLARLTGAEAPPAVVPQIPVPASPGTGEADGEPEADAAATDDPPDGEAPDPSPSAGKTPEGLSAADLGALIAGEDAAGFALRQRAAMAEGNRRERLLARSEVHVARGEAWAVLAGTAGTDQDPRRVAYEVPTPDEQRDRALVRALEDGLAVDYASLVATSAPGTRAVLVDLLVEAALAVDAWDAPPSAFPGLPELAAG
jgi:hypothetical protein